MSLLETSIQNVINGGPPQDSLNQQLLNKIQQEKDALNSPAQTNIGNVPQNTGWPIGYKVLAGVGIALALVTGVILTIRHFKNKKTR
jgi:hypothetical protein